MICPTCNQKMVLLLTSYVCDNCDNCDKGKSNTYYMLTGEREEFYNTTWTSVVHDNIEICIAEGKAIAKVERDNIRMVEVHCNEQVPCAQPIVVAFTSDYITHSAHEGKKNL